MKLRDILTKRIRRPCRAFALGALVAICCLLLAQRIQPQSSHEVSAHEYATLTFREILTSNGVFYGRFTIRNDHEHPVNISMNNIEVRKGSDWSYYATVTPSFARPELGNLGVENLRPGRARNFLVPTPPDGDGWR